MTYTLHPWQIELVARTFIRNDGRLQYAESTAVPLAALEPALALLLADLLCKLQNGIEVWVVVADEDGLRLAVKGA